VDNTAIWLAFAAAAIRMASPILLASLGEIYAERSGLLNIALEGMMLFGAFTGFVFSHETESAWIGLFGAMASTALVGLLFAFLTVSLRSNQVVVGIALNLTILGLATYLYRILYGVSTVPVTSHGFTPVQVPLLSEIPLIGPLLFTQTPLPYLAILLVPISTFVLWRTRWGLRLRACGENPTAAMAEGVPVRAYRYAAAMICGALAGAGGAFLTLDQLNVYVEDMTAGRGFIGLAVVIFGRWHPVGAAVGALLFGAAEALSLTLQVQGVKVSHYLLLMTPYVLTVLVLIGLGSRSKAPAALGLPLRTE
jgi:ABC-type uncharacterized transport system permease subunit